MRGADEVSEDTGVKDGQDFFEHVPGSLADELDLSCAKIDGFDLLDHDEANQVSVVYNGHVKRKCLSVLVIGQTIAKPVRLLNKVLLTTRAGLRPFCSCLDCGSKLTATKSPFRERIRSFTVTARRKKEFIAEWLCRGAACRALFYRAGQALPLHSPLR